MTQRTEAPQLGIPDRSIGLPCAAIHRPGATTITVQILERRVAGSSCGAAGAVGQLDLDFEAVELPSEPRLQLNVYTAAVGTPTSEALKLLASWAATQDSVPTENSRDAATR